MTKSVEPGPGPLYHFFSGKGGVGKTTLAAATATHLARSGMRVLITSTDPAHSLSDVFDVHIGHHGIDLAPNLRALEVDSTVRWTEAALTQERQAEADGRKRGKIERALGDAMRMLGEAPGVDEFISLELLLETMTSTDYDAVVFDTAPTGHTLRLLTLPEMLDGWLGRLLTLRSQFAKVGRAIRKLLPKRKGAEDDNLAENLLHARERISLARQLITDHERTLFSLVTIPEAMSVLETHRTMQQLAQHHIPLAVVIANQVQPDSDDCEHCRLRHRIHERELVRLREICGPIPLKEMDSKSRIIRGVTELAELGQELWKPEPD